MKKLKLSLITFAAIGAAVALSACGGSSGSSSNIQREQYCRNIAGNDQYAYQNCISNSNLGNAGQYVWVAESLTVEDQGVYEDLLEAYRLCNVPNSSYYVVDIWGWEVNNADDCDNYTSGVGVRISANTLSATANIKADLFPISSFYGTSFNYNAQEFMSYPIFTAQGALQSYTNGTELAIQTNGVKVSVRENALSSNSLTVELYYSNKKFASGELNFKNTYVNNYNNGYNNGYNNYPYTNGNQQYNNCPYYNTYCM